MMRKPPHTSTSSKRPRSPRTKKQQALIAGGGEMGTAMRQFDWTQTVVGPPHQWPPCLRIAVNMIVNSAFPMFVWWGRHELTNFYNDAYKVILGQKHQSALGRPAPEVWMEIWDKVGPLVQSVFATGNPVFMKDLQLMINRHGYEEETYFTFSYGPIYDEAGNVAGLLGTVAETTQEVIRARQLKESQAQLEAVFHAVRDGIAVFDMHGEVVLLNDSLAKINGYSSLEEMRQNLEWFAKVYQLMLPDKTVLPVEDWPVSRVLRGETFTDWELRGKRLDTGQEWFFSFSGTPVYDHTGQQILAVTVTRDITKRKAVEEELGESERRFRSLADTAPMYIAMADETGQAVYFNKPWLYFTGKKMSEMKGKGWLSTLHPEDAPKFRAAFREAFYKQIPINNEYRFRRADGEYRWMLAVGAPRFTPDGRFIGYFGTYTDFHELKEAQLAIQENEKRFRTLANNISQLAWMADEKGEAFWYNQRWHEYTGASLEQMKGDGWKSLHHPGHAERVVAKFEASLARGQAWEDTFPLRGRDGRYRWFLSRAIPIRDDNDKIIQWFGTHTDIEDLRLAIKRKNELENTASVLKEQQAQLLALNQAKDEFISLASHQLRTPATGVKQYLGMLLEGFADELTTKQRTFAENAYASNERQLIIVSDLLSVAQADAGKIHLHKKSTDLVRLVKAVLEEQTAKFASRHQKLFLENPDHSLLVMIDEPRMRMVLENIIDNASKYTPTGKQINVILGKGRGEMHYVRVTDQGVGIDKKDLHKIFHKFVRVSNDLSVSAGGSGLGLYLASKIVELHGGSITVQSRPGKGSVFTVSIPGV